MTNRIGRLLAGYLRDIAVPCSENCQNLACQYRMGSVSKQQQHVQLALGLCTAVFPVDTFTEHTGDHTAIRPWDVSAEIVALRETIPELLARCRGRRFQVISFNVPGHSCLLLFDRVAMAQTLFDPSGYSRVYFGEAGLPSSRWSMWALFTILSSPSATGSQ